MKRLRTNHIDLYQVSKDPAVPIEDAVGAIGDLVQQGYVRYVGLTNAGYEAVLVPYLTGEVSRKLIKVASAG